MESESMGQVWHPIGEDENPWCGVRTCRVGVRTHGTRAEQERVRTYGVWVSTTGVRSGAVGWSQDPWDKDRPQSGLDVVAMWDMAECPSHAGAVWVLRPVPCCHTHHLLEEAMPVPAHSLHQMQKLHRGLATPHSVYGASAG